MIQKNTILIVDDQRSNVEFIADILSNTYDVKAAIDGKKALKLLEKFEFDLILLDVQMPDMNGYEVAQKILSSERTKDTPIIFLTSLNDEASIVKGFEMGAVDYVTKPFNTQELLVRVANHIQMHALQHFLQHIINSLPSIVFVTTGEELKFVNQGFLNFFQCNTPTTFLDRHRCICNTFLHDDQYFHLGKVNTKENWIEKLIACDEEQQIVAIYSQKESMKKIFKVNVNAIGGTLYLFELHDISQTMNTQQKLLHQTLHDPLTNAFNREFFTKNISTTIEENQEKNLYTLFGF